MEELFCDKILCLPCKLFSQDQSSYYLSVPTYFCYNLNTLCLKNSVGIFKCTVSVKTSLYISGQGTRAAICYINFKLPYISYLQLISIKASISECYISIKYTPVYSKLALAYFCYLWLLAIFAPIVFFFAIDTVFWNFLHFLHRLCSS